MEAFVGQMGYFLSSKGPTGQKGIHRDLVSNGALDTQLFLALKSNYQVTCIWTSMKKWALKKIHKKRTN